jgi:5'-methylthioadenosine nucleosidase
MLIFFSVNLQYLDNTVSIQNIMLVVAMNREAQPIIELLKMKKIDQVMDGQLPASAYGAEIDKGKIILVVSGKCASHHVDRIGTQGLNLVAWEALKAFSPDLIINAGTAGGFLKKGAAPGDIYVSTESIKYHDRLFSPDMHFLDYGVGSYQCLSIPHIAKELGFKEGIISTGGSLLSSEQEIQQMERNNAAVKEMEAAGIAEVAQMRGIPFIGLKIVTDLVDTDDCPQNQFTKNFDNLIIHFANKVQQLCVALMGKSVEGISMETMEYRNPSEG